MTSELVLRDVVSADLSILFAFQLDREANHMAAFTAKDPTNQADFAAHWRGIMSDPTVLIKVIEADGEVAGTVLSYEDDGKPEVSYWLGRDHWGKGIATWALTTFLVRCNRTRPMYARVAKDNMGSRRVLEKCGFTILEESMGFANARGGDIEELLLELRASPGGEPCPNEPA